MNEIELITKALQDAYKFVKEQEQTKETGKLLINLFKAEILVKNCYVPAVVGQSEQLKAFRRWMIENECTKFGSDEFIVNDYLKSL